VHSWTEAGFSTVGHIVWTKPYASSSPFVRVTHESAYIVSVLPLPMDEALARG